MRRAGVILLLVFETVWLNAFLPGHTRGVITIGQSSCCQSKHGEKDRETPQERAKHCAVCYFAARLTTAAPLIIELPPPALVDELPAIAPVVADSLDRIHIFDSRGPPLA